MSTLPWLSIIVFAPMIAALIMLVIPAQSRATVRILAVLSTVVSFAGSVHVALTYNTAVGGVQLREAMPLLPSLGISWNLGVDVWGVSLLLLTSLIIFAGVFATWTLEDTDKDF